MPYSKSQLLDFADQLTALDPVFDPYGDDTANTAARADRSVASAMIESTTRFTLGDVLNMRRDMELSLSEREAINHHLDGSRHRFLELQELYTNMANDYGDRIRDPSWSFEIAQHLENLRIGFAMLEGEFSPIIMTPEAAYQPIVTASSKIPIGVTGPARFTAQNLPDQFDIDDLPF